MVFILSKRPKDPVLARINRVEGQVAGVKRMYEGGRGCVEIVQQVQAARAALGKLAETLLTNEARRCADSGNIKELKRVVERSFKNV